jgi:co-chaperonin GroES (HSP10)
MEKLQPLYDNLLVEVDWEWRNEITTKSGVVGVVWEDDRNRAIGAQRKGVVTNVPRGISQHHYLSLIQQKVEIGDTVYFHFNSVSEDTKVQLSVYDKPSYLVHLENVFAILRNGKIIMYADRVFCEPVFDDDIVTLEDGMKVKKSKSGIITQINVSHNMKRAILSHIGYPLKGRNKTEVEPGDKVYYEKDADFENEIEGKVYFCMIQDDILLKEV